MGNWNDYKGKWLADPDTHNNVLRFNAYLYGLQFAENDHIDENGVNIMVYGGEKEGSAWKGRFNELKYVFRVKTSKGSIYKFKNVKWIKRSGLESPGPNFA